MRKFFLFFIVFLLFSFTGTSLKKRISDSLYRYEFYTTDDVVTAKSEREYFWFKGGAIHNSEYGMAGELLHDEFLKFYHNNQLAEAGRFNNGLKTGYWKAWFKTGTLQSKIYWDEGQMNGSYLMYNSQGTIIEEGKYKDNVKHGRWINHITHDTLKYSNGIIVPKKIKDNISNNSNPGFFKRLFTKKEKVIKEDPEVVKSNPEKEKKKSFLRRLVSGKEKTNRKGEPKELKAKKEKKSKDGKKEGFFKRLFSKKDKKQ